MIDADLSCSTQTAAFAKEFPERFIQVGIAEGNMIGVAAGMTVAARPVFANGMSPFLIARAYEQIKVDVAGANLPVKLVGTHAGLASGLINTTVQVGGAIGLAVLATLASGRTGASQAPEALLSGYHLALGAGATAMLVAAAGAFALTSSAVVLRVRDVLQPSRV